MLKENYKWVISTGVTVIGLILPIVLYIHSLPEKLLEYEILSKSELISDTVSIDKLEVRIKGESITEAFLYSVIIKNVGSVPVLKNDFDKRISIKVANNEKIYYAKLKEKVPSNLPVDYQLVTNKILIEPLLLNSGDKFVFDILSSSNLYPTIDARVAGIKEINKTLPESKEQMKKVISFILSFILLVFYSKTMGLVLSSGFAKYKNNINSRISIRLSNGVLSLTCAISSAYLLKSYIEVETSKNLILFSIVPIVIGFILAYKEQEYNKSLKQTT